MLSTRPLMSEALPAPSMIVVFSFSTRIFLASPRSLSVAFSSDKPTSSEMTLPPVRTAMSCNMALRRSPKPGALTATTLTIAGDRFNDKRGKRFAFHVFCNDQELAATLGNGFEQRQQFANVGD